MDRMAHVGLDDRCRHMAAIHLEKCTATVFPRAYVSTCSNLVFIDHANCRHVTRDKTSSSLWLHTVNIMMAHDRAIFEEIIGLFFFFRKEPTDK